MDLSTPELEEAWLREQYDAGMRASYTATRTEAQVVFMRIYERVKKRRKRAGLPPIFGRTRTVNTAKATVNKGTKGEVLGDEPFADDFAESIKFFWDHFFNGQYLKLNIGLLGVKDGREYLIDHDYVDVPRMTTWKKFKKNLPILALQASAMGTGPRIVIDD